MISLVVFEAVELPCVVLAQLLVDGRKFALGLSDLFRVAAGLQLALPISLNLDETFLMTGFQLGFDLFDGLTTGNAIQHRQRVVADLTPIQWVLRYRQIKIFLVSFPGAARRYFV